MFTQSGICIRNIHGCGRRIMHKRRVVDFLIYLVVRTVVCVLECFSLETARAIAATLGDVIYLIDKRHRQVARENLTYAFGDSLSAADRERMVRQVYRHFCAVIVEMLFISRKLHVCNWKKYLTPIFSPAAMDLLVQDRAKIMVTGHFGNWEMAGFLMAACGLHPSTIARDLDNPFLHRFVLRKRSWSGQRMLSKKGDFDRIRQTLIDRQMLVSVGDQSAGDRGLFVPFFGRLASTHKAIALLAIEHNAPIVVGYAYRTGPTCRYEIVCEDPIEPTADPEELTAHFTRKLEDAIRRAPEQYFWLHRRWKHAPPERRRARQAA